MKRKPLDNPKLLAQCERVKGLIQETARVRAGLERDYFVRWHHYQLNPTVSLEEIDAVEQEHGVELPEGLVYWLNQVGNGGAGPGTGFHYSILPQKEPPGTMHGPLWKPRPWIVNRASEQLCETMTTEEWKTRFDRSGEYRLDPWERSDPRSRDDGTFVLSGMDTTYLAHLIVVGPERGKVVYMDYDYDCPPMWPKGSAYFLDWCENWFRELASGYDIDPTWKFMWQQPGDENALRRAYQTAPNKEYRDEVLWSFRKFPKLSAETMEFLQGISDPEHQEFLESLLKKHAGKRDRA